MQIVNSKLSSWTPKEGFLFETGEGLTLTESNKKQFCKYYGVPGTLVAVDKKFGTNTLLQVAKTLPKADSVQLLVEDNKVVSVLDPKSRFISDEEFEQILVSADSFNFDKAQFKHGLQHKVQYKIPKNESDNFLGDVFTKSVDFTRLPQGGIAVTVGTLRLVCTNGATLADKQFKNMFRTGEVTEQFIQNRFAEISAFNLENYLRDLWQNGASLIPASVTHYQDMKKTIATLTDPDTADIYFPEEFIEEHYLKQDIELAKLDRQSKCTLPAGISYYDCVQIMTNAAKQVEDMTLEQEFEIAKWSDPHKVAMLKKSSIQYQGVPEIDSNTLAHLKGDL